MPLNTIYQVRMRQTYGVNGKPCENVFFFDHTAGAGNWESLNVAFGTAIGAAVNALQTGTMRNLSFDTINLGTPTDFGFTPWLGGGTIVAETLPAQDAIAYTLKLNTRAVAKGSKRFAGVPETAQQNGEITQPTYLTAIEALRIILQQELVSADDTWLPVVLKRIRTAVPGTVPQKYKYRLPSVGDPLVVGEVVAALTGTKVKHQVSRGE